MTGYIFYRVVFIQTSNYGVNNEWVREKSSRKAILLLTRNLNKRNECRARARRTIFAIFAKSMRKTIGRRETCRWEVPMGCVDNARREGARNKENSGWEGGQMATGKQEKTSFQHQKNSTYIRLREPGSYCVPKR